MRAQALRPPVWIRFKHLKKLSWKLVRAVLVTGICFIILYPIFIRISTSLMEERDLYDLTVYYIPKHFTLANLETVWEHLHYIPSFLNTVKLSLMTGILQLAACVLAGYGFARYRFPLKKMMFGLVLLTIVVPPQAYMVPLYLHFRFFDIFGLISLFNNGKGLNLLNTSWPFILLSVTGTGLKNGLYIYLMRQNFRGISKEIEEAAYVDGSGIARTFLVIMAPCAVPMMLTIFLISFVWQWNDVFYFGMFLDKTQVLSTQLAGLAVTIRGVYTLSPGYTSQINAAGSILVIFPLIILYLCTQRYFTESIERSGIVG